MNEKFDSARYEELVREAQERFPGITLPSEYAELFENNTLMLLIKLARYKFAARLLKPNDDVLEVGSGNGIGTIFLAQHAKRVTGLEIKEQSHDAACAVNRRTNVVFLHRSLFEYEPPAKHDAIVSLDVIEHLPAGEGRRFVERIARLCRPDGLAIIGTPSIYSLPYQGIYSQAAHVKCYDRDELMAVVEPCFTRAIAFSMNDEVVHTGHPKMAWYYFVIAFGSRLS